jgi:hypothetical protein
VRGGCGGRRSPPVFRTVLEDRLEVRTVLGVTETPLREVTETPLRGFTETPLARFVQGGHRDTPDAKRPRNQMLVAGPLLPFQGGQALGFFRLRFGFALPLSARVAFSGGAGIGGRSSGLSGGSPRWPRPALTFAS